jgi:hypothetical protein
MLSDFSMLALVSTEAAAVLAACALLVWRLRRPQKPAEVVGILPEEFPIMPERMADTPPG